MKKNKNIVIEEVEKFRIPQIESGTSGMIRKKSGFKKSPVASAIHGTHVIDKNHYIDNSGTTDIDYSYDFVRTKKHISDEELEKKYGTKYYEFNIINREMEEDIYKGSDYSKNEEEPEKKEEGTKGFSFISTTEEILEEDISTPTPIIDEEPSIDEDYSSPETEFVLNINIDEDEPTYEYNTYDSSMPKPEQTNIPPFLNQGNTSVSDEEFEMEEELTFETPDLTAPTIEFENPPVDKNQTIAEAIENMEKNFSQPEPKVPATKKISYADYKIPCDEIFKKSTKVVDEHPEWLEKKKEAVNEVLRSFDIDGEVVTYTKGPAFTRYEVCLAPGVSVKKITSLYIDFQKDLEAESLRILAPIPGKNTVGIEIPNDVVDVVAFGDILTEEFMNNKKPLEIALGKNIDGTPVFQNITNMPHALIAGATQSGKSVSINTILVSLLIKHSPEQLRLILVDPKKVELSFYNDLPHLATPVIDDAKEATQALKWSVEEMERRYEILARNRVKNIGDYNEKRKTNPQMENMPYIVIVVDEFNELIMQCGNDANDSIVRLAQKARACGIHIILATQRPTVDVVSGIIKANITCRIAFKVASEVDSRTILDETGAETLLGRGDMLIKNNGNPLRAQGAYISDNEITAVCDYICDRYEPNYLFTHEDLKRAINKTNGNGSSSQGGSEESDELLYEIALSCIQRGKCSINELQKAFSLGFNRAQAIVQILEEMEIVSVKNGTKQREILVDEEQLKQIFGITE